MTTIRYFIPEDGDEESHPNVFLAPKPRQPGTPPTLQAVRDAFPLPGRYHFRFKSPLFPGAEREKGAIAVWMDVTRDAMPVPTWNSSIVAKVTRISMEEEDDDDDDDDDFRHHHPNGGHVRTPASAPAPPARPPPSHASSTVSQGSAASDHLDIFDGPSPGGPPPPSSAATPSPNLFDSHPPSAPPSGGSLLDFGAPSPAAAGAVHNDFLGMTAPPQQQRHRPPPSQPQQQQQWNPPPPHAQQQQQPQSFNNYSKQAQPFGDLGGWT